MYYFLDAIKFSKYWEENEVISRIIRRKFIFLIDTYFFKLLNLFPLGSTSLFYFDGTYQ